ncbi:VOC family protein [Actibacterium lipolyticum]|uniref:Glyoxalase-like domain protein n=1 Tax=Actibacterium lipolyticum TaxID=1524263 RepID=A0A238KLQ3_9RHOB|nr:VOC family protein [Actibacterium lipolyticum]SMX43557.1 Glyoxalase-like domain protein [Actibacterium lipolyticum]
MSFKPTNPTVWIEIPVTDMTKGIEFYKTVFNFEFKVDETGPNPVAMICAAGPDGVAGHLYPGKPSADGDGPTVHLAVHDTVEEAMDRLVNAGGTEVSPVITIPPGRFAYAQDPEGNSIGLFEPNRAA